jgi:hypothetical protein
MFILSLKFDVKTLAKVIELDDEETVYDCVAAWPRPCPPTCCVPASIGGNVIDAIS